MAEVIVIEPGRYEHWTDLWRYRELFRVLAWRDLAVRYKQTVIGAAWAVIRPFLTMLVLLISERAISWNSSLYRVVI
jgi:lipopolysaccharide transport system permease protein